MKSMIKKDFYSVQELANQPWFPVRSPITVRKLIEAGRLEAVDISTNPRYRQYKIKKESIIYFLVNRDEVVAGK